MEDRRPDFLIVGAMKCATTTLHEQLARQPGFFMSHPKEPNFFSDDEVYARGLDWYWSLFPESDEATLRGESSTHYTKLPTFPHTVERMVRALPRVKLIYIMRHPIDRLISHYMHERSLETFSMGIEEAVDAHPPLVEYGRYAKQLRPYLEAYAPEQVLPVFFGRLVLHPQDELERICRFAGSFGAVRWDTSLRPQNVATERLRKSALRDALVRDPLLGAVRRRLLPKHWTETVKALWRWKAERPELTTSLQARLADCFDEDLEQLGSWLGIDLNCANFTEWTEGAPHHWVGASSSSGKPDSGMSSASRA